MKYLLLLPLICVISCTKSLQEKSLPGNLKKQTVSINNYTSILSFANKRTLFDHDGNEHDPDDWSAARMNIAMMAKKGLQSKLAGFLYSNEYWKTNSTKQTEEKNAVINEANAWGGYDMTKFIDVQKYHSSALSLLVNAIQKSTATDSLIIIAAGTTQLIGQAIAQVKKGAYANSLHYVNIIEHSQWNAEHAGRYGSGEGLSLPRYNLDHTNSSYSPGATFISDFGVKITRIRDQNSTVSGAYSAYYWLRDATDSKLRMIWDEAVKANKPNFDDSDCGMWYYALTGDQNGSPSKLRSFFGL